MVTPEPTPANLSWKDLVTALIALYGAVLSTVNLVTAMKDRSTRIHVDIMDGVVVGYGPLHGRQLRIAATNTGRRLITLTQCYLEVKDFEGNLMMNNAMALLPKELSEGQLHSFAQPVENLFDGKRAARESFTLRAVWCDSAGKTYPGKWITVRRRDSSDQK